MPAGHTQDALHRLLQASSVAWSLPFASFAFSMTAARDPLVMAERRFCLPLGVSPGPHLHVADGLAAEDVGHESYLAVDLFLCGAPPLGRRLSDCKF